MMDEATKQAYRELFRAADKLRLDNYFWDVGMGLINGYSEEQIIENLLPDDFAA
jgi:hypothetical protein